MNITTFDDLLAAARAQPQAQRLLFVFAGAELGDAPTPEQRRSFDAGRGGELAPTMCVDKTPDEIGDFVAFCDEARRAGPPWALVFAAALSGHGSVAPDSAAAQAPLKAMVEGVRNGKVAGLLAFDNQGHAVNLS